MAEEVEIERQYQARFTREVELATWYDIQTCFIITLMILRPFYPSNWLLLKYCTDSMNESSFLLSACLRYVRRSLVTMSVVR